MTKNEALNEFQSCIDRYRKLLARIYNINNYSNREECNRYVKIIKQRIDFNTNEYKCASTYNESVFIEGRYEDYFDPENSTINSCSSAIDRLEALYGINSNKKY